jgi:hypothetical protein
MFDSSEPGQLKLSKDDTWEEEQKGKERTEKERQQVPVSIERVRPAGAQDFSVSCSTALTSILLPFRVHVFVCARGPLSCRKTPISLCPLLP